MGRRLPQFVIALGYTLPPAVAVVEMYVHSPDPTSINIEHGRRGPTRPTGVN